jgi:hypothetical protein
MITPMATKKHPRSWLTLYLFPRKIIDRRICHTRKVCKKNYRIILIIQVQSYLLKKETLLVGLKPTWAIGNMNTRFCVNKYRTKTKLLSCILGFQPIDIKFNKHLWYVLYWCMYSLNYIRVILARKFILLFFFPLSHFPY